MADPKPLKEKITKGKSFAGVDTTQDFDLVSSFNGYRNKEDKTNLPPGYLVKGSKNVLVTTGGRVGIRPGYTLDGQSNATVSPIKSSYDYEMHTGSIRNLRAGSLTTANNDGKLQCRYVASAGDYYMGSALTAGQVKWIDILTGLTSVDYNFADYWDNVNLQSLLLFVNGQPSITEWTGGITRLASSSNLAGIISGLNSVPTNGGSGYVFNDVLTIITGGGNATCKVISTVDGAVATVTITTAGTGYTVGDTLTLVGPINNSATCTVTSISGGGSTGPVTGVSITTQGYNYFNNTLCNTIGGTGSNCQITVNTVVNGSVNNVQILNPGSGYSITSGQATSGGTGTGCTVQVTSTTAGAITKQGTTSFAEEGFYTSGTTHKVMINGVVYSVLGGWGTNSLVGISPTPPTLTAGELIIQVPETTQNSAMPGLPNSVGNDLISSLRNQVYVASFNNRSVYISKVNNYKDYTLTSPVRLVGEGAILTLDGNPVGFVPQESLMYITAGTDQWYETQFILSSDNSKEDIQITRLKTASLQAAQSQAAISKIGNSVVFVSKEPTLTELGRVANVVLTPQTSNLSDPIKLDFDAYDFTDCSVFYYRYFIYIAVPKEGLVLIYNIAKQWWEAPQVWPISRFAVIEGSLYGHSYQTPETYKLFNGWNDNGHSIEAVANFSYQNYGLRANTKYFNEFYSEGYIDPNTILNLGIQYEIDGCATETSFVISGNDSQIVCLPSLTSSLGKESLGKNPLGGELNVAPSSDLPPKFRVINTMPRNDFYEAQYSYKSIGTDFRWEVLAFGPLVTKTMYGNNQIKK